jgi:hypothetical protein
MYFCLLQNRYLDRIYIKGIIELKYCIVGSKPVSKFEMGFFFEIEFNYQCTARVLQLSVKKCYL